MDKNVRLPAWREWTLFGVRWLLLVLFAAVVFLVRGPQAAPDAVSLLLIAVVAGVVANSLIALLVSLKLHSALTPVIVGGDLVTAAAFIYLSDGNPLLIIGIAGTLMLSAILRLGSFAATVQSAGIIAATVVLLVVAKTPDTQAVLTSSNLILILLIEVAFAAVAVAASYVIDRQLGAQQQRIVDLATGETTELKEMRERTRAIYELSTTISSNLDYDKILSASLDAGQMALRGGDGQSIVSAVLLFRAYDNALHVAGARRLTRSDETVVVPGKSGIVAEALRDSTPVFAASAKKDPELQFFTAFQYCRSLLCVPLRAGFDNYGVVVYGSEREDAFDIEQSELLSAIGSQATIALQNAVLYRSLIEEKERIVEVEEDARKKLARDLHDGPTQSVAAIAMRMAYIQKLMERNPQQVPEELKKVEELARRTTKEIRHMLFTLRPLVLETQGLGAALTHLGEKMQETHGQAVAVRMGKDIESVLSAHQQGILFYIVEEAVNNARKHARADLVTVALQRQESVIVCQISDNGAGFDTGAVSENYEKRGSLGMVNMHERAEMLDATLRLESARGKGTTITVVVPVKTVSSLDTHGVGGKPKPLTKLALSAVQRYNEVPR